jgi:hypothetical protein
MTGGVGSLRYLAERDLSAIWELKREEFLHNDGTTVLMDHLSERLSVADGGY